MEEQASIDKKMDKRELQLNKDNINLLISLLRELEQGSRKIDDRTIPYVSRDMDDLISKILTHTVYRM